MLTILVGAAMLCDHAWALRRCARLDGAGRALEGGSRDMTRITFPFVCRYADE